MPIVVRMLILANRPMSSRMRPRMITNYLQRWMGLTITGQRAPCRGRRHPPQG
jgi:hypothetical protein